MLESVTNLFYTPLSALSVYDVVIIILFILALILTIIFSLILISSKLRRIDNDIKENNNAQISDNKAILSYLEIIFEKTSKKYPEDIDNNNNLIEHSTQNNNIPMIEDLTESKRNQNNQIVPVTKLISHLPSKINEINSSNNASVHENIEEQSQLNVIYPNNETNRVYKLKPNSNNLSLQNNPIYIPQNIPLPVISNNQTLSNNDNLQNIHQNEGNTNIYNEYANNYNQQNRKNQYHQANANQDRNANIYPNNINQNRIVENHQINAIQNERTNDYPINIAPSRAINDHQANANIYPLDIDQNRAVKGAQENTLQNNNENNNIRIATVKPVRNYEINIEPKYTSNNKFPSINNKYRNINIDNNNEDEYEYYSENKNNSIKFSFANPLTKNLHFNRINNNPLLNKTHTQKNNMITNTINKKENNFKSKFTSPFNKPSITSEGNNTRSIFSNISSKKSTFNLSNDKVALKPISFSINNSNFKSSNNSVLDRTVTTDRTRKNTPISLTSRRISFSDTLDNADKPLRISQKNNNSRLLAKKTSTNKLPIQRRSNTNIESEENFTNNRLISRRDKPLSQTSKNNSTNLTSRLNNRRNNSIVSNSSSNRLVSARKLKPARTLTTKTSVEDKHDRNTRHALNTESTSARTSSNRISRLNSRRTR